MNWRYWTAVGMAVFGLMLSGCSSDDSGGPTVGSESHFMGQCEATRDCVDGLACHCGICTTSCADDETCSDRGPAMCAPADQLDMGCAESASWAGGLCLGECTVDADCGREMACSDTGWCQRRELPTQPDDGCDVTLEATPHYGEYAEPQASKPSLSQGKIYFSQRVDDEASDGSLEAFSVDAQTHEQTRLTSSAEQDYVRAATGTTVLLADTLAEPTVFSTLDAATQDKSDHEVDGQVTLFTPSITGDATRIFDGDRLLYSDGGSLILLSVDDWTVSGIDELPDLNLNLQPTLTPRGFAYSAYFADRESGDDPYSAIYQYRTDGAEENPEILTDHDEFHRNLIADGDDLYWRSNQAVYVAKDGLDPERIHEGSCRSPHASGGRAVFACSPSGTNGRATSLFVYDGTSTREVVSLDEETFLRAPRIGEHGIVWLEFLTAGMPNATGRLMYYDLEYDELLEIDQVGAECMTCGRQDPPTILEIEGDVVTWNYASPNPEELASRRFGYTTIQRSRDCQ